MTGVLAGGLGHTFAQTALSGPLLAALGVSALAGLVSFLSPCVLPLVPGYVGYVTGLTGAHAKDRRTSTVVLGVSLFVLGFAVVFVCLGTVFSSLGALLGNWTDIAIRIMGVFVVIAGIVFMGGLRGLQRERRVHARPRAGLWGAPLLGATFALGWAPCIGPTLAAVLALSTGFGAEGASARGALLTFAYCLGLGVPFLIVAVLVHKGMGRLRWVREHQRGIQLAGGAMLVAVGLVLISGLWTAWMSGVQNAVGGFETVI
ncbi:cytochrome c biogenesis protein CcdA [Brevibacterium sp. BRM-1]|uniref:cytochrome c biogenesis CcdA family protein n=1 Tax=Brevibacterium sp. BRM-1 TaxID=2999062 RepID=UPI00227DF4CA|nr:cytochrome c biogenesis protein CcdA [Brevibacterium sp. BRM-1]WAL41627.1 cytochrome c biogenesis protein CcdA [Brevibacterium sp. BRM-1]